MRREQVGHESRATAMTLWADGERQIDKMARTSKMWYLDYQSAVADVLVFLQCYNDPDSLFTAYFNDHAVENYIAAAVSRIRERNHDQRILNYGLVEDLAFLRRMRQLNEVHHP